MQFISFIMLPNPNHDAISGETGAAEAAGAAADTEAAQAAGAAGEHQNDDKEDDEEDDEEDDNDEEDDDEDEEDDDEEDDNDEEDDDEDDEEDNDEEDDNEDDAHRLLRAASLGDVNALEAILNQSDHPASMQGLSMKLKCKHHKLTPLMAAVVNGHGAAVSFLLEHPSSNAALCGMMGTDGLSYTTALCCAARSGHVDMFPILLGDPRVDAVKMLTERDRNGMTVLMWAMFKVGTLHAKFVNGPVTVMRSLFAQSAANPAAMLAARDFHGDSVLKRVVRYHPNVETQQFLRDNRRYMLDADGYITMVWAAHAIHHAFAESHEETENWHEIPRLLKYVEFRCQVLLCLLRGYCKEDHHARPPIGTLHINDIELNLRPMINFDWPSATRDEIVRLFMELQIPFRPGPVVTRIISEDIHERKRLRTELDELRNVPDLINEAVISMAFEYDRRVQQKRL